VGHSDGGSIGLIHAGARVRPLAGLVTLAAHVMVEDLTVESIAAARRAFEEGELRGRLARHHDDVDATFRLWADVWLSPAFRRWSIEELLPRVGCPVLAIQGEDDEYGTRAQLERIARGVPDAEILELRDCRHSPHRDQPEAVLGAIEAFVDRVAEGKP
jgi:pimeloyl-ACP methyl ester carboxylesterase